LRAYEGMIGLSAGVIPPPHLGVEDVCFLGGEFMVLFICDTYATDALSVLVRCLPDLALICLQCQTKSFLRDQQRPCVLLLVLELGEFLFLMQLVKQ
jgi:hypothetical protein